MASKNTLVSVKLSSEAHYLLRLAAAARNMKIAEYLSEIVVVAAGKECAKINGKQHRPPSEEASP